MQGLLSMVSREYHNSGLKTLLGSVFTHGLQRKVGKAAMCCHPFLFFFHFLRSSISKVWENRDLCGVAAHSTKKKKKEKQLCGRVFPPPVLLSSI